MRISIHSRRFDFSTADSRKQLPTTKQNIEKALMACFQLKRHVLNCFIFSDYESLRDARKKTHNKTTE
jgi:hypothetical protein